MDVTLVPEEKGTKLTVDAQIEVNGRLATLGMPMIKRRAEQNFKEFESRLQTLLEKA
jgi:carbon monoxide dehydrogenase subunit G